MGSRDGKKVFNFLNVKCIQVHVRKDLISTFHKYCVLSASFILQIKQKTGQTQNSMKSTYLLKTCESTNEK